MKKNLKVICAVLVGSIVLQTSAGICDIFGKKKSAPKSSMFRKLNPFGKKSDVSRYAKVTAFCKTNLDKAKPYLKKAKPYKKHAIISGSVLGVMALIYLIHNPVRKFYNTKVKGQQLHNMGTPSWLAKACKKISAWLPSCPKLLKLSKKKQKIKAKKKPGARKVIPKKKEEKSKRKIKKD